MKTAAVIPCYNEEKTVADIVKKAKQWVDKVIVVDNLSIDTSIKEAKKVADAVFTCTKRGAGVTTAMGINYALKTEPFVDAIITLDSDGQHNPDEIPVLLNPLELDCADLVIGSRFLKGYSIKRYRKVGIDIITWLFNVGSYCNVVDSQCCFRAFNRKVAEQVKITEHGFGFTTEFLIKAREKKFRVLEVPISCIYHEDGSMNSTQNPFKQGVETAFKTIKWRMHEVLFT